MPRPRHAATRPRRSLGTRVGIFLLSLLVVVIVSALAFTFFSGSPKAEVPAKNTATQEHSRSKPPTSSPVDSPHLTVGLHGDANTIVRRGDPYIESGAYCIDDRSGMVEKVETTGKVDTKRVGEYTVYYRCLSDNAQAKVHRKISVVAPESRDWAKEGLPVMMYHNVYDPQNPPSQLNNNFISIPKLEEQLEWLKTNQFYYPSFSELRAWADKQIALPAKSVILTFDDGDPGFLQHGRALLDKYQIPATSFLIGTLAASQQTIRNNPSPYVDYQSHSWDMHKPGGHIGHGGLISALNKDQIKADLTKAIYLVKSRDAFAYPFGDVTEEGLAAVKELDIKAAFTTKYGKVRPGDDFRQYPRVRVSGDQSLQSYIASL